MRDSTFKKGTAKMRSGTHFTKSDAPVSSFSGNFDGKELISRAMEELSAFLSGLRRSGFSEGRLKINITQCDEKIAISVTAGDGSRLGLSEINLICRLAVERGLSPHVIESGVEVIYSLPRLVDANLYSRVLALLRESVDG